MYLQWIHWWSILFVSWTLLTHWSKSHSGGEFLLSYSYLCKRLFYKGSDHLGPSWGGHTGSFHKYDDDGLQQAVFIKKWLFFWPKQLHQVIFDTGFSAYYFRTTSFWYTDLQTHVLFFNNVLLAKIVQILVLKFIYSEKAKKFCEIFTLLLTVTT